MKTNVKTKRSHVYSDTRTAGGYGVRAAKQNAESQLRRAVMACLLWEDIAYAGGGKVADHIRSLVPIVDPEVVAAVAVEARERQKLRHVPLLIVREMARHESHRGLVADTLARVIRRPDELSEFVSIYWRDNGGKKTLSAQVKGGLAKAFRKFDEYQFGKWDRKDRDVKLRDVLFLCHAKPKDAEQESLWKQLIDGTLPTPDTWEVGLSAAKTEADKRAVWERLVEDGKLGALALMKNLRNMESVKVSRETFLKAFRDCRPGMLLPIDFLRARNAAPTWSRQIEDLMLRCASEWPKLPGWTIFVVDVSGSMGVPLSRWSQFSRMDAAAAMTVLASEVCENISVYATAGDDWKREHATVKIEPLRGFAMADAVASAHTLVGGGGIFTRQMCNALRDKEEQPDRIIIFSDSQDCDYPGSGQPNPHGKRNYIVDVSCHSHGINYEGVWDAEVSGWSEHFLRYIAETEATCLTCLD